MGTGYGPSSDFIDVEVVFWVDTFPGQAFGFRLREGDANRSTHAAMLDLLRDAYFHNARITFDYSSSVGKLNSTVMRL